MNETEKTLLVAIKAKVGKGFPLSPAEKKIWNESRLVELQAKIKSGAKLTFSERNVVNIFKRKENRKKAALKK